MIPDYVIEAFTDKFQGAFDRIWVNWLVHDVGIQPQLEDVLEVRDPFKSYIDKGGAAFYAISHGKCVGIVAVKPLNETDFEFCKLVVLKEAHGNGLGEKLIQACIDHVREVQGVNLYLQSIRVLKPALGLYEKMGFENAPPPESMFVLNRTEIIMRKIID
jgi:GNAT superfamily N-acetyltransferase